VISSYEETQTLGQQEPIRGDRGASILGPRNMTLERENPDLLASPITDAGTISNLKFSFAAARHRLAPGGWAREVTVRELPVATQLAGAVPGAAVACCRPAPRGWRASPQAEQACFPPRREENVQRRPKPRTPVWGWCYSPHSEE